MIFTTPYHGYVKNLALSIVNGWDRHFSVQWDEGHVKYFSVKTLSELLTSEGLKVINFKFAGRLPLLWKSMICVAQYSG